MATERTIRRALLPVTGPRSRRAIISGRDSLVGAAAALRSRLGRGAPPDYVIVGAQKAGTTFLYQEITRHPDVGAALTKEIHFFDDNYRRGLAWYEGFFSGAASRMVGEASPGYLFHPFAVRRLAQDLPKAKLIVLLRDPVRRAYSHYQHECRLGFERVPTFEEALTLEDSRLEGELEHMQADELYVSPAYRHYSYRARGLYLDQVRRCHEFAGRDRVLVLRSEDLYKRTVPVLEQVFQFLELPSWVPGETGANDMASPPSAPLAESTQEELRAYYRPYNERLYEYLGWDHGWEH